MPNGKYTARDITVLDGLEAVRKRPGMYIGGTGRDGLHHLVAEILDNSVDEALNGHASHIHVHVSRDGRTVAVSDNGRGIPVDLHPKAKVSALEVIFTQLHAGAKFDQTSYATAGGLHGVGASVVNALSSSLQVEVRRDGQEWRQEYRRGRPRGPAQAVGPARGTGTRVTFTPDEEIFGEQAFDPDAIREMLDVKAYLHPGLRLTLRDETRGESHEFRHDAGLADYLAHVVAQNGDQMVLTEPFTLDREERGNGRPFRIALAIQWTDSPRETLLSFVNGIPTRDGGTHEQGFKEGVVRAVRNWVETHEKKPRGLTILAEDVREGLVGVVSLLMVEPQFQGQTKDRLNNPEVRGLVEGVVRPALEQWLHEHGSAADTILARILQAIRAREASRSAVQAVRRKSAVSRRLNLPGKLSDCASSDPEECEIFIVEGDSAGGSAKQGRDRETQAILPLRGKVLNAEQASLQKVLSNAELSDVVRALGCGTGRDFDLERLRYHRVVLLMDADSDGHHIATLLLTFFYRHLPDLIRHGHVYIAQPPLYRIDLQGRTLWAADDAEKERMLKRLPPRARPEITRFKGLGEMMPRTLYETTLDPRRRRLLRVRIPEGTQLEAEAVIQNLLGRDPAARYEEIMARAGEVGDLDV